MNLAEPFISPEDERYLRERGFVLEVSNMTYRLTSPAGEKLMCRVSSPPQARQAGIVRSHWVATFAPFAIGAQVQLVVSWSEGHVSPVTCFVTAEIRQWTRE